MIENLFIWTLILSSYAPTEPPTIVYMSHGFMEAVACSGQPCGITGLFIEGDSVIFVEVDLPIEKEEEVIIHETVHYLQELSGKFTDSCFDRSRREVEAYMISRQYTKLMGRPAFPMGGRRPCWEDEE